MNSRPPDIHDDELRIHSLFSALRKQTVQVARGLADRISANLAAAEERRVEPPGLRSMFADSLIQFLNLLTGMGSPPDRRDDDDS